MPLSPMLLMERAKDKPLVSVLSIIFPVGKRLTLTQQSTCYCKQLAWIGPSTMLSSCVPTVLLFTCSLIILLPHSSTVFLNVGNVGSFSRYLPKNLQLIFLPLLCHASIHLSSCQSTLTFQSRWQTSVQLTPKPFRADEEVMWAKVPVLVGGRARS